MASALPVLIVSSQACHRDRVAEVVRGCGLRPVYSPTLADARSILAETHPAVIFCGDDLPDSDLRNSLAALTAEARVPVIALSRLAEWTSCVEAFSAGAFDYVACPPDPKETARVLHLALDHCREPYARHSAA
jgi:DNA-binding NtrC family response regulator